MDEYFMKIYPFLDPKNGITLREYVDQSYSSLARRLGCSKETLFKLLTDPTFDPKEET